MKELAQLKISQPGGPTIDLKGPSSLDPKLANLKVGDLIGEFLNLTMGILAILMFIWCLWGAFQYLFAGGDKGKLEKARKRITYAIIGFVLASVAWLISGFIQALATKA